MTDDKPLPEPTEGTGSLDKTESFITKLFVGPHGMRAGWRLLAYGLLIALGGALITAVVIKFFGVPRGVPGFWPSMLQEVLGFALAFGAAGIMALIEHRKIGEYGLPASDAFGKKFWLGFLFGLVEIGTLMGLIAAFGGYSFGSLALQGGLIVKWGLLHLIFFTFVGLFEEFLFRGYTQYTLADGVGFWPAAILLSVAFGSLHLKNPGEGPVGAAGVVMVALLFCFSLKRTGNLWYAVGLHASFDWGETFLFSVPNSGVVMQGHLSDSVLHGPKWLTGGTVGPEGSVFCFLTLALQFFVVNWLFPAKKAETATKAALGQS
jgi:membrane protease YdiL (CAAX protease family)